MTLRDIVTVLNGTVWVGKEFLDIDIQVAGSADLMSDFFSFTKPGSLILTGLANAQVIRTASIIDAAAVVIVRGKKPPKEALRLAIELQIPVISTDYILFEASGLLYGKGMLSCLNSGYKK